MSFQPPGPGPEPQQPPVPPTPPAPVTARPDPREFGATMINAPEGQPAAAPAPAYPTNPYGAPTYASSPISSSNAYWRKPWTQGIQVLGVVLVALLAGQVVLDLVSAINNTRYLGLVEEREIGEIIDAEAAMAPFVLLRGVLYLATIVIFLVWLHRVWTSDRSDPAGHRLSSGMAVGGWFIPIANLVFSFRSVKELWNGVATAQPSQQGAFPRRTAHPLVVTWYLSFLAMYVSSTVANVAARQTEKVIDADSAFAALEGTYTAGRVANGFSVLAAAVLIVLVSRIHAMARR